MSRTRSHSPVRQAVAASKAEAATELRILVLAPTLNDAQVSVEFLNRAGIKVQVCRTVLELFAETAKGCGAVLLAEEVLASESIPVLMRGLAQQPAWSDIPVVIVTSGGEASQVQLRRLAMFGSGGNVSLLERPLRPGTMISALETALRARRRQYEVRRLMEALREREERIRNFYESSHDWIAELDLKGRMHSMNRNGQRMLGYEDFSRLEGQAWAAMWMTKDRPAARAALREARRGGVGHFQGGCAAVNGAAKWWDVMVSPILDGAGRVERVLAVARDITETKRHEAEMTELARQKQAQARLFDTTLSSITDLAYTFDLEGNWIYANKPLLKLWGKTLKQITGKSSLELGYPPELAERLKRQVKEVARTGKPFKGETYYTDASGKEDYHEYIFSPVVGPDGKVTAVCGTTRLTTERKRAEAVAEGQRRVLHLMAEDAPLSNVLEALLKTVELELGGKVYAAVRLLDRDRYHLRHIAAPGLPAELREALDAIPTQRETSAAAETNRPVYTTDIATDPRWSQWKDVALAHGVRACWSFPIYSTHGEVLGTFVLYHPERRKAGIEDLQAIEMATRTAAIAIERKLSDAALRASEEASRRLAAIVESSDDAIISKDLNGIIQSWNHGAERLFGYQASEVIGKPVTILIPEEHRDEEPGILERIRRGESVDHYECVRRRKDGNRLEISLTVSPMRDAWGKVIGASKIARDITQQKRAERELARAHGEAVTASRAKDDFLAALSHELRTPLNPVLLLASEAAVDPELPPAVRAQFATIRNNVELEARLIDDLLDLTRITHGKMRLNLAVVDVHTLLNEAVTTVRADLDQKRIQLALEPGAPGRFVRGDAARLQQVFWNVLKNAAKFTPEGGSVRVATREEAGNVVITITDSGIGLTAEERGRIFEAFTQGDHASGQSAHRFGGLGLGLAISRMLMESHGGRIEASSEGRGRGAVFTITLPQAQPAQEADWEQPDQGAPARTGATQRVGAIHILLVEDHEPTRTTLARLLGRRAYAVTTAATVAEAREQAARRKFEVLITDIGLPDGNGFELMREMRAADAGLRGLALTGYGMEEDVARSRAAGFASHLTKPVRVQMLDEALQAALGD
jgi:PAS domain S-box-containing protein